MKLAIFAAYAFRKYTSAKVVFGNEADAEGARLLDGVGGDQDNADEFVIDPSSLLGVYQHMLVCKNTVPTEMIPYFAQLIGRMGTIDTQLIQKKKKSIITIPEHDLTVKAPNCLSIWQLVK